MCETNYDSRNTINEDEVEQPLTGCCALSRRGFITRSALASAGLVIAPTVLAEVIAARKAEAAIQLVGRPSAGDQKKIGQQAVQQVLSKYREVNDSRASHFRNMGQRLVSALPGEDQNKWDYSFRVLDSKEVNAFALPGGPMFMFTGLYNLIPTDDALAAVTGHEMAHVYKEHWAKAHAKSQERALGLGLLLSVIRGGQAAQIGAGVLDTIVGKKYSRSEEDEADKEGLEDLVAANYNPKGMIQLFQVLQKQGGGGGIGGEFLADHPLTSNRIKNAQKRIAALGNRKFPPMKPLRGSQAA
jgi:predicted Zn-dependent protease